MELQVLKLVFTAFTIAFLSFVIRALDSVIWRPQRLRSKLRQQGIRGPPVSFLIGNLREMKLPHSNSTAPSKSPSQEDQQAIVHGCCSELLPFPDRWRKQYGRVFMFSIGNIQTLCVSDVEAVREISTCTSLDLGKPSFQLKMMSPLLGQGVANSNGAIWAHQKKILTPEFYVEKVKGMMNSIVESAITLVNSWSEKIEEEGGVAEIKIDSYMRSFTVDVISRACFGSHYAKGHEIFSKLRALEEVISDRPFTSAIPGFRYLPTRSNREIWNREREVNSLILKVLNERKEATTENDLLQMILEGAKNNSKLGHGDAADRFIVDSCKNIYFAGYGTTSATAIWTLMLLASNPGWQAKAREEVMQALRGGQLPDADMIWKMKTLTMVINETIRLYSAVPIITREALGDLKFGDIQIPKGVNVWVPTLTLNHDPEIWGSDADQFNPERFANGINRASKLPYPYMPFGSGSRPCVGQNLAIAELKVLLALVLSNFSLSISPKYRHSPCLKLVVEAEFGVDLLLRKL